jgi:hypothetical protein
MWGRSAALLLVASFSAQAEPNGLHKVGYAVDLKSGATLYSEHHTEQYSSGALIARTVEYRCPDGRRFAEKTLTMAESMGFVPDFETRDLRTGYREGVRSADGSRSVFFRRSEASKEESKALPTADALVGDAGFDVLIGERFDDLLAGDTIKIEFLVPSRLSTIAFRLRQIDPSKDDAKDSVRFQLAPDSALFRLLVDPLEVSYDRATRRLLRFEGLTNLRDPEGSNYSARIDFPATERVTADTPDDFPEPAASALGLGETCTAN